MPARNRFSTLLYSTIFSYTNVCIKFLPFLQIPESLVQDLTITCTHVSIGTDCRCLASLAGTSSMRLVCVCVCARARRYEWDFGVHRWSSHLLASLAGHERKAYVLQR